MDKIDLKIVRPFGPTYAYAKIPNNIVETLNNYIDKIVKDKNKKDTLNFGESLVGDVTEEFLLEKEIAEKSGWLNFLSTCVHKWIEIETGKKISTFNVLSSWIVRQFEGEYNPVHIHSGHLSGVGYLKVPDDWGSYSQNNKRNNQNGKIDFIFGNRGFLSNGNILAKPKVGDFYLFPNYLFHTVYPFSGNEERRSVSFNARIDENIYNS